MNFRYLWMGLATLAGAGGWSFFAPCRYAESVTPPARYGNVIFAVLSE